MRGGFLSNQKRSFEYSFNKIKILEVVFQKKIFLLNGYFFLLFLMQRSMAMGLKDQKTLPRRAQKRSFLSRELTHLMLIFSHKPNRERMKNDC